MLSGNKVTSTKQISSRECLEFMKKLNIKKVKWITKEVDKREKGVWTIAQIQNISKQHAYRAYNKYKDGTEPEFKKCGRKTKEITDKERRLIIDTYKEFPLRLSINNGKIVTSYNIKTCKDCSDIIIYDINSGKKSMVNLKIEAIRPDIYNNRIALLKGSLKDIYLINLK